MNSVHLAVVINRSPAEVYAFVTNVKNLPLWAAGVDLAVTPVEFAEPNDFGVMDHTVTMPDGSRIAVPLRVQPLGAGSEVVFTLREMPGTSDEEFEADRAAVEADLETLAGILDQAKMVNGPAITPGSVPPLS